MSLAVELPRTLSPRGRTVVLLTCCLSVFVAGLDVSIANVALPSIQRALHASVAVCGSIVAGSSAGFIASSHAAWAVLSGCGIATVLLGLISTGRWARSQAERIGRQLSERTTEAAR